MTSSTTLFGSLLKVFSQVRSCPSVSFFRTPFETKTISRFLLARYYVRGWSPTVLMCGIGLDKIQCDDVLHGRWKDLGQRFVGPDEILNQVPRPHKPQGLRFGFLVLCR